MPQYLSPGVYVEEVPSGVQPIAGVGTSTAGFIGIVPDSVSYKEWATVTGQSLGDGTGSKKNFDIPTYPVNDAAGTFEVLVDGAAVTATLSNDDTGKTSKATLSDAPAAGAEVTANYQTKSFRPAAAGVPVLCTNFAQFKKSFGDFSLDAGQNRLAHAAYGFFNNGGTRCWVVRTTSANDIRAALVEFEAIDEIALVAAPGLTAKAVRSDIDSHCAKTGDRFAIYDSPETVAAIELSKIDKPDNTNLGAYYFPWIEVFDPTSGDTIAVPPSGHLAGVYARVDTQRGVHKAPANETIRGALGLKYRISRSAQDGLNPAGVNCIRDLNGNIRVWGARTVGGDANGEWKYVNVRRLFLFLRESIDEGTQWVVFEPNDASLWAKIIRNVTAFLTNIWRSGALFGATPEEAFYVKCDAELNPPEVRDLGQVITEIGVAVVKPAEFVIFRISQKAEAGGS